MAGQWAMAPLPQWTPGDSEVAYQGGSAVVVTTSSKHPKEAAEFAAWINSSDEGADIQLETGQYPASTLGQTKAETSDPPLLMPQQTDFWQLASKIAGNTIPNISWGPNVNVAQSAFQDAMAKAVQDGTPLQRRAHRHAEGRRGGHEDDRVRRQRVRTAPAAAPLAPRPGLPGRVT